MGCARPFLGPSHRTRGGQHAEGCHRPGRLCWDQKSGTPNFFYPLVAVPPRWAGRPRMGEPSPRGEDFCCWETSDFLSLSFSSSSSSSSSGSLEGTGGRRGHFAGGVLGSTRGTHFSPGTFQGAGELGRSHSSVCPATHHRVAQTFQVPWPRAQLLLLPQVAHGRLHFWGGSPALVPTCSPLFFGITFGTDAWGR